MQTNGSKLKQVLAAVFGGNPESVDRTWSMETVEKWDSLNHLKLVLALEEDFGVSFTEEQLTNLFSYESIESTLTECGVNFPQVHMDAAGRA
jgi:acyl carrier protein